MDNTRITVFGGSGFLGTYLVRKLAQRGAMVQVVCRHPNEAQHLRVNGPTGRVTLRSGNIRNNEAIANAVKDADVVINLVGILYQSGKQRFEEIHAQGAERIAAAAKAAGVKRLIHVSAVGSDRLSKSRYARSKLTGEQAVMSTFPKATIVRPSVMFGPEDDFFNRFASLATIAPVLPLIGGGKTKMQPVYVGDVAEAICNAITHPDSKGNIYELGGAEIMTFREILEYILRITQRKAILLPLPFSLASLLAFFLELAPIPILTRDQVKMLRSDNVVSESMPTFKDLGIQNPTLLDSVVPGYLKRYSKQ